MPEGSAAPQRIGRAPATTHGELSHVALTLFLEQGFDRTTADQIASAAGISRRTLFRYFRSKNDLAWGDFDGLLESMREHLAATDPDTPLMQALREAIVEFNSYPEHELPYHRSRMDLLLNVPSLTAHSTLRYAGWRRVIAEYVADRREESPDDLTPQTIAWACLGLSLSAYEQWLAHEDLDLVELIERAFDTADAAFGAPEAGAGRAAAREGRTK